MARLISFFGDYSEKDNSVTPALRLLRRPDGEVEEYSVESIRTARRVKIADIERPANDGF